MLWYNYNLLGYKKDTFDIKWLKVPFYFLIFSFFSNLAIGYFKQSEPDLFATVLFMHSNLIYSHIFYFILFMTQNFFSHYKKIKASKYVFLLSLAGILYYAWNNLLMTYQKRRLLWFIFEI